MNLFKLSWTYIRSKPWNTLLNVIILSLGISIIIVLLILSSQVENKLTKNAENIDLVVGAKGSPMQLILSSIFHVDYPTGNIPYAEAEKVSKSPFVKNAVPLAMGDSYSSYRIVGTEHSYPELYSMSLREGELWDKKYEVSIGSVVAEKLGLKLGSTFSGQHGMAEGGFYHEGDKYEVVGIFEESNTVLDNLILTNIESVWGMHEHKEEHHEGEHAEDDHHEGHDEHEEETHNTGQHTEVKVDQITKLASYKQDSVSEAKASQEEEKDMSDKEITALLIQYATPMAIIQMPRLVNSRSTLQAASPAFEMTRLFSLLGVGIDALKAFAYMIIFISCLSIFIALYNALKERKYDLAIMRSMGATRLKLFIHVLLEGIIMTTIGGIVGLMIGHGALVFFTKVLDTKNEAGISGMTFQLEELYILILCVVLGIISALIPAINAYRTDISKVLAEG